MVKIATFSLAILCVVISIYSWLSNTEFIFSNYGYSTENLLSGNFLVLLSSIFLHANLEHLVSNLIVLLLFGITLEEEIGSKKFLLLFFGGAFFGDILSSLIYPANQISVGASAGIFSIIGATMLIKPIRIEIFLPIPLGIIGLGYLIYAIVGAITGYPQHVAHVAHIGGSLIGLSYGFYKKGFRNALRIIIALFLLLLFVPVIWNLWVLIMKSILGILASAGILMVAFRLNFFGLSLFLKGSFEPGTSCLPSTRSTGFLQAFQFRLGFSKRLD